MKELLKELCSKDGVSGSEQEVREYIKSIVQPYADEMLIDDVGNLIVFKKGAKAGANRLLVCAHMDEVGLRVRKVCDDGKLSFFPSGNIENATLMGSRMRGGRNKTKAVIYCSDNRAFDGNKLSTESLFIDVGADGKNAAESVVSVGDFFVYDSEFLELKNSKVKAKAIENRLGCAVMIKMLQEGIKYDTWFVFSACGEMSDIAEGGRGAMVAAVRIEPDICMVVNTRGVADLPGVPERKQIAKQGSGAVIAFADNGAVYNRGLIKKITNAADTNGVKWQYCTVLDGITDAKNISTAATGSKMFSVSAPVRYVHTANNVLDMNDAEEVLKIAQLFIGEAGDYNA